MQQVYSQFTSLEERYPNLIQFKTLGSVPYSKGSMPIVSFEVRDFDKKPRKNLPTLALFAGVHGLEAIGVKVLQNFVENIVTVAQWDAHMKECLSRCRVVGIPLVNPVGYRNRQRSNHRGVDLMRNAPVDSVDAVFFAGGQTLTSKLPYFRGFGSLEIENLVLQNFVRDILGDTRFCLSMDLHSGFGFKDRVWTPFSYKREKPLHSNYYRKIKRLLDVSLPHHLYKYEQQSDSYLTHGDIWDYLYESSLAEFGKEKVFLPLTLEIGSWNWVKKSILNVTNIWHLFNPIHDHREKRVLRRHNHLLRVLLDICHNSHTLFKTLETEETKVPFSSILSYR